MSSTVNRKRLLASSHGEGVREGRVPEGRIMYVMAWTGGDPIWFDYDDYVEAWATLKSEGDEWWLEYGYKHPTRFVFPCVCGVRPNASRFRLPQPVNWRRQAMLRTELTPEGYCDTWGAIVAPMTEWMLEDCGDVWERLQQRGGVRCLVWWCVACCMGRDLATIITDMWVRAESQPEWRVTENSVELRLYARDLSGVRTIDWIEGKGERMRQQDDMDRL